MEREELFKAIMAMRCKGDRAEALELKPMLNWILEKLPYKDFRKLFTLGFTANTGDLDQYYFAYSYHVLEKDDTPKARKAYLEYLAFKLLQNLATPSVELA